MRQYSAITTKQKKKQIAKKSSTREFLVYWGAIAALLATGTLIVGSIWVGILWMIDPNSVVWLNRFLPEWTRIPITEESPPQTLTTIQDEVRQNGLIAGEPLSLDTGETLQQTLILLPILKSQPNCQTDCQKIVELRVYQPAEWRSEQTTYNLVNQFTITEPEEYLVLSSLQGTEATEFGAYRSLPLTKLTRLDDKAPSTGIWFNLSGEQVSGDSTIHYGQVIHYNPDYTHLSVMLEWTSPNEQPPTWRQITGDLKPELLINQTVGLEPRFKVYQIQPRKFVFNPIQLDEISLDQPALDNPTYRNTLMLARNGLWSVALKRLQSYQETNNSATVQAQKDVIQLHAQFTQSQANQTWASPSQQILSYLIDGRWVEALQLFQVATRDPTFQEIVSLLKTDSGGLWQRVEAALKVYPDDSNVKAWGALILAAQQGRAQAIAWLNQLPSPNAEKTKAQIIKPDDYAEIVALLDYLDTALVQGSPTASITSHLSQIVGTAQKVTTVKPSDWLQPEDEGTTIPLPTTNNQQPTTNLQKDPQQVWYQIQVAAFNDGDRWRQNPFSDLPLPTVNRGKQLWQYLGLDTDPQLQIAVWTSEGRQESTTATVQAVSYRGGIIQLLAAGNPLPSGTSTRPLAYSDTALQWLEPGSVSLSDLNQLQHQWVGQILPVLWRELANSGKRSPQTAPSLTTMLQEIGHWSIRPIDLTGNSQPEALITLYEDLSGTSKTLDTKQPINNVQRYKARTMIFSDKGVLLYSEFSKDASTSLTAIADLGDGQPPVLVLNGKNQYSLKRWSSQRQRLE